MEINDQVLKTLTDADRKKGNFFSLAPLMEKNHPILPQVKIAKIMNRLEEKGFIRTSSRKTRGVPHFVKVNRSAHSYFEEKEERKALLERKRSDPAPTCFPRFAEPDPPKTGWSLRKIFLIYTAGLITGIALMIHKSWFFP